MHGCTHTYKYVHKFCLHFILPALWSKLVWKSLHLLRDASHAMWEYGRNSFLGTWDTLIDQTENGRFLMWPTVTGNWSSSPCVFYYEPIRSIHLLSSLHTSGYRAGAIRLKQKIETISPTQHLACLYEMISYTCTPYDLHSGRAKTPAAYTLANRR